MMKNNLAEDDAKAYTKTNGVGYMCVLLHGWRIHVCYNITILMQVIDNGYNPYAHVYCYTPPRGHTASSTRRRRRGGVVLCHALYLYVYVYIYIAYIVYSMHISMIYSAFSHHDLCAYITDDDACCVVRCVVASHNIFTVLYLPRVEWIGHR
jgi:hypothetical protein